ncbi:hypothetical protein SODALDRAFT_362303 [Sodiomyces alkalinus F11]|uniref:Uncharacterized protein n=1 Tax=Sodiomyces alkalinus (strain CBS 110278 / VKM F-3762 / F11) TaxID=1314773 RepID=A0A3N2PPQ5_SODAK|nr:hypothetical protein SODALDRAFT_362303 [Sodiomyces alkalinus F11]ROT36493.1 hypothetical protein SODALDRAFT_362303 [Sodiomyces alkalinus F11]
MTKTEDGKFRLSRSQPRPYTQARADFEEEVNWSWFERYYLGQPGSSQPAQEELVSEGGGAWMEAISDMKAGEEEDEEFEEDEEEPAEDEDEDGGKGKARARARARAKGKGKEIEKPPPKRVGISPISRVKEFVDRPSSSSSSGLPSIQEEEEEEEVEVVDDEEVDDEEVETGAGALQEMLRRAETLAASRAEAAMAEADQLFQAGLARLVSREPNRSNTGEGKADPADPALRGGEWED